VSVKCVEWRTKLGECGKGKSYVRTRGGKGTSQSGRENGKGGAKRMLELGEVAGFQVQG